MNICFRALWSRKPPGPAEPLHFLTQRVLEMHIVIVDREPAFLEPLMSKLKEEGFEVSVTENIPAVMSVIKLHSIQFLVADSSLLVGHSLGDEVHRLNPLARLIVLAARPSLLGMIESISAGMTDYLPRSHESFDLLVNTILDEREKLKRWQCALLSASLKGSP
jgi:DNA-binding NtrC family response regulator